MNKKNRQKLAELNRQIKEMTAAGNRAGAAAAHSQKALLYALSFDMQKATLEMSRAGALAQEAGRYEEVALAHLAQGKAMAAQPGGKEKARELLESAAALYHTLEDKPHEVEAFKELAALDAAAKNIDQAIDRITKAIALLNQTEDAALKIDLLLLRANYHLSQNNFEATRQDLESALALAQRTGNKAQSLAIRAQQQIINGFTTGGGDNETWQTLQQEAAQAGNFSIAGNLQLQQANEALVNGRFKEAVQHAESVRRLARESDDLGRFTRYLAASTTLASALEKLGDKRGVLYALLSCKLYLERNLGKETGQQINLILDAYKERWGEKNTARAVQEYQAWMQAQQKSAN